MINYQFYYLRRVQNEDDMKENNSSNSGVTEGVYWVQLHYRREKTLPFLEKYKN